MKKIISAVLIIAFSANQIALAAPDLLRPVATKIASAPAPAVSQRDNELAKIKQGIEKLWQDLPWLWHDYRNLADALEKNLGLRVKRLTDRKIVLESENSYFIIKINNEPDFAYEKEKAFCLQGYNALGTPQLLYYHDQARVLIFNNVTKGTNWITLFDYIHTPGITAEQLDAAMSSYAKVLAQIHSRHAPAQLNSPIYQDQSFASRLNRVRDRVRYLTRAGYTPSPLEKFRDAEKCVLDHKIVFNHGDPTPWNIFVDPWTGQAKAIIDTEASSIGTRSKELAKVILALIDARKNNPALIQHLGRMLSVFFKAYFEESNFPEEAIYSSIPYYLATQLIWYAETTQRTFGVPSWVSWRLDLSDWALAQSEHGFKIENLIAYLEAQTVREQVQWKSNLFIHCPSYSGDASGVKIKATPGDVLNFNFKVWLGPNPPNAISMGNVIAEFWTDMNTGIWRAVGPLEFIDFSLSDAVFKGSLVANTPSGQNSPYGVTARISLDNGKTWHYAGEPLRHAMVEIKPQPKNEIEEQLWRLALSLEYGAIMLDYDGTLKFYNGNVPDEIYELIAQRLSQGIAIAINSTRANKDEIEGFFLEVKAAAMRLRLAQNIDWRNCHIYLGGGEYGYNFGTKQEYYRCSLNEDAKIAARDILYRDEFRRFVGSYSEEPSKISFIFRGGVDRSLFAEKLNEALGEINDTISQPLTAVHTEDYFDMVPQDATKQRALEDFALRTALRTGVPVEKIARMGDQGQRFGADNPMLNGPGGFSVFYTDPQSNYPIDTLKMANLRGADATVWLLQNLKFTQISQGLAPKGDDLSNIFFEGGPGAMYVGDTASIPQTSRLAAKRVKQIEECYQDNPAKLLEDIETSGWNLTECFSKEKGFGRTPFESVFEALAKKKSFAGIDQKFYRKVNEIYVASFGQTRRLCEVFGVEWKLARRWENTIVTEQSKRQVRADIRELFAKKLNLPLPLLLSITGWPPNKIPYLLKKLGLEQLEQELKKKALVEIAAQKKENRQKRLQAITKKKPRDKTKTESPKPKDRAAVKGQVPANIPPISFDIIPEYLKLQHKVVHKKYGEGTVVASSLTQLWIEGSKKETMTRWLVVTVSFPGIGKLLTFSGNDALNNLVPLKAIGTDPSLELHPPNRNIQILIQQQALRPTAAAITNYLAQPVVIGVPKEIKQGERRAGLTPKGVKVLTGKGIRVIVETGVGKECKITDEEYIKAGAEIAQTAEEVWRSANLIKKVKEPLPSEYKFITSRHTIFTYLHLAANKELTEEMIRSGALCIAYETVEKDKATPLLKPMSGVAGIVAAYVAAIAKPDLFLRRFLTSEIVTIESFKGALGKIVGNFPDVPGALLKNTPVVILGGGVAGINAAEMCAKMGAKVTLTEDNPKRVKELREYFRQNGLKNIRVCDARKDKDKISKALTDAAVIISAVYIRAEKAPDVINEEELRRISARKKKLIIDIAIDQGGSVYGSRATTHEDPIYFDKYGNIRYCVPNMPAVVPNRIPSEMLEEATLPYTLALTKGLDEALREYPGLESGININNHKLLIWQVAKAHQTTAQRPPNDKEYLIEIARKNPEHIPAIIKSIFAYLEKEKQHTPHEANITLAFLLEAGRPLDTPQNSYVELLKDTLIGIADINESARSQVMEAIQTYMKDFANARKPGRISIIRGLGELGGIKAIDLLIRVLLAKGEGVCAHETAKIALRKKENYGMAREFARRFIEISAESMLKGEFKTSEGERPKTITDLRQDLEEIFALFPELRDLTSRARCHQLIAQAA